MTFRVEGLDPARFRHLIGRSAAELAAQGVRRVVVDARPGYPDRITVRDLAPGDTALLLHFEHQPAPTPFRAGHAIYIGEHGEPALDLVDDLPEALLTRPVSLRAFTAAGDMVAADLGHGEALKPVIARLLADPAAAYLHAHYAAPGCYAARIVRA